MELSYNNVKGLGGGSKQFCLDGTKRTGRWREGKGCQKLRHASFMDTLWCKFVPSITNKLHFMQQFPISWKKARSVFKWKIFTRTETARWKSPPMTTNNMTYNLWKKWWLYNVNLNFYCSIINWITSRESYLFWVVITDGSGLVDSLN